MRKNMSPSNKVPDKTSFSQVLSDMATHTLSSHAAKRKTLRTSHNESTIGSIMHAM
jgi:hypothetical protein